MCKCVLLKWIYDIHEKHSLLHFSTVLSSNILTVLFVNNDTRTFHSDGTDMFIDINTFER